MHGLVYVVGPGSRLAAAAVAVIVFGGLLAAPNTVTRHDPPRYAFSVDLQATSVDWTHPPAPTAAMALSPEATTNGIEAIALATLWYLAFPVTVPVSFLLAGWLGVYALGSDGRNPKIAYPWLAKATFDIFVHAPLNFISYAVKGPVPQRNVAAAVATIKHSPDFRAPGQGHRVAHGVASSPRPANSNRSTTHPNAARSGRPAMKERSHD